MVLINGNKHQMTNYRRISFICYHLWLLIKGIKDMEKIEKEYMTKIAKYFLLTGKCSSCSIGMISWYCPSLGQ